MSWGDETWMSRMDWREWDDEQRRSVPAEPSVVPIPRPRGYAVGYESPGAMVMTFCILHRHSWVTHNPQVVGIGLRCRHCWKVVPDAPNQPLPAWLDWIDAAHQGIELPRE